jgi:N-acetylmuramoyl-L-alanine amidase
VKTGIFTVFAFCGLAALAQATAGLTLRLPDKSPLTIRTLDASDPLEPIAIGGPVLYLGGSLIWQPASKTAEVDLAGNRALLLLEEPVAYLGQQRLRLPSALHWKDGSLVLARPSLELLLKSLSPAAPAFESASAADLGSLPQPVAVALPSAEPTLEPAPEPVIVSADEPAPPEGPLPGQFCVVIDAGHGGKDPGAHGRQVDEKDVCLDIARKIRDRIHARLKDVKVILTRQDDHFITLRRRTEIANNARANLFISIHNNASPDTKSHGSQVFFYDSRSSDRAAEDLAKRENEDANYLEFIMMDLTKSLVRDQSIMLAQSVQNQLASLGDIKSRRLSYAPFYVLARTKMPAILVEVAFITNPNEGRLLKNEAFRAQVADDVVKGLSGYRTELAQK